MASVDSHSFFQKAVDKDDKDTSLRGQCSSVVLEDGVIQKVSGFVSGVGRTRDSHLNCSHESIPNMGHLPKCQHEGQSLG